ncbi:hypothetical protein [Rhizobacter sp. SG703]|uniref:hypothetical protein n=1 Tax=Rhizobacter sp. SG703 TaxID=2587140 RepID=UPI001448924D|nr:hypothetical protein [Rhizobacter sp. SG703]NKI93554.1 hypothetical protein [Rhizobacter sp. SG703]
MTFINEYISAQNIKKYDIEEIDRRFLKVTFQPDWTVDKERDIYLRFVGSGREEFATQKECTLYWYGVLLTVRLDQQTGTAPDGSRWRHYKLLQLDLPESIADQRSKVVSDLKEGLIAYQGGGVYSSGARSTTTFDF